MRITTITVNLTETCNLGDHSNTKPSIELTAQLEATDYPLVVLRELIEMAKGEIRQKIDEELEKAGKSPKYYDGPLFSVYHSGRYGYILVAPAARPHYLSYEHTIVSRVRREVALAKAQEVLVAERERLFDGISDEFTVFVAQAEAEWKRQDEECQRRDEEQRRQFRARIEREQEEEDEEEEEGKAGDQGE